MFSGNVIQLSINRVRWHHQFPPNVLQKGEAPDEDTFFRGDIRATPGIICEAPLWGFTTGARGD